MNDIIIKAEDVFFSYEDGSPALNGINLEIKQGKKIAFMGANGSGKSTFFLCLNGIHRPQKGKIYFHGSPIDYSRKGLLALRSKIGIVFQDPDNQLFSASVYQEISFGILNLGISEKQAEKEVEKVIKTLEITPFRDKPTHALSGGQKKQVSIADILVMHPDIIILDEPAAALDPKHTALVNGIIDHLTKQGITVILSTHDVDFAFHWADEVVLFHKGRILTKGNATEVFSNQTALHATNLEQPAVLKLFDRLCQKEILKPTLPIPKDLTTLESYIEQIKQNQTFGGNAFMSKAKKQAILVVSFGTSYEETRKKTIDQIEKEVKEAYPESVIYRAWTSKMIIQKLWKTKQEKINTVSEACEQMLSDGITDLIVQPTHIINGIENDLMKEDVISFQSHFSSVRFGAPLLTSTLDSEKVIQALMKEFSPLPKDHVLVFMGHGTTHFANSIYAALDYTFKDKGYPNVFLGTVESYPSLESLLRFVTDYNPKKVILAPFMIVAGDHAHHDMASDQPNSWRCQFEKAGFLVECIMKGIGEYKGIRDLILEHIKDAME